MSEMKSLADQLRKRMAEPDEKVIGDKVKPAKAVPAKKSKPVVLKVSHTEPEVPSILEEMLAYDTKDHKVMVHARFDAGTSRLLNQMRMATGIENTRLCAFAVQYLFRSHPELKEYIINYFKNNDL